MKIDYRDAYDATVMSNAVNLRAIANTMKRMFENACELNEPLKMDVGSQEKIMDRLRTIIDEPMYISGSAMPLRRHIFGATKYLYWMAYRVSVRNLVMAYPPLTIAAQVLANITYNASLYSRQEGAPEVPHEWMAEIDYAMPGVAVVEVNGERFYANFYDESLDACEQRVKKEEQNDE